MDTQNFYRSDRRGLYPDDIYMGGGVFIAPDSPGYIEMSVGREAFYPILLWIFRTIFGETHYFMVVVWLQTLLTIFAIGHFVIHISREYKLPGIYTIGMYFLFFLFYVVPAFLTYSHWIPYLAILTEGITYALYILYAEHILLAGSRLSMKDCNIALAYAFLLSFTRGGLMPTILVVFLVRLYIAFRLHCIKQGTIKAVVLTVATFLLLSLGERTYFAITYGRFMTHTYGAVTTMSNVVYASDKEDSELILDETSRAVFEEMWEIADREGWMHTAVTKGGLLTKALGVDAAHDPIKFQAFEEALADLAELPEDSIDAAIAKDEVAKNITHAVFFNNLGRWTVDYIGLCLVGFIRTITYSPEYMSMRVATVILYAVALFGIWYFRKNERIAYTMAVILLLIAANVCAVSLVIMPLQRYMFYNWPIFYVGLMIMLCYRKEREAGRIGG
jgi:hypothetical protein